MMLVLLLTPATALAVGDQVNRPDGSGVFDSGQKAQGELPEWAPRAQQSMQK